MQSKSVNDLRKKFNIESGSSFDQNLNKVDKPRLILTGFDQVQEQRKKIVIPNDVKEVVKEAGLPLSSVSDVRESGLTADQVESKRREYELPSDEEVFKNKRQIIEDAASVVTEISQDRKEKDDNLTKSLSQTLSVQVYKDFLFSVLQLPWYKRFGKLNKMIIDVIKNN